MLAMSVPIKPLVDRIMGGTLVDFLTSARADGLSYERTARKLAAEHDIDVSAEQVRKWCTEVEEQAS